MLRRFVLEHEPWNSTPIKLLSAGCLVTAQMVHAKLRIKQIQLAIQAHKRVVAKGAFTGCSRSPSRGFVAAMGSLSIVSKIRLRQQSLVGMLPRRVSSLERIEKGVGCDSVEEHRVGDETTTGGGNPVEDGDFIITQADLKGPCSKDHHPGKVRLT